MKEIVIFGSAIPVVIIIVALIWYLRFHTNKAVAERVRLAPQQYTERTNGIYHIRLPNNRMIVAWATPPPSFSKAVGLPKPVKDQLAAMDDDSEDAWLTSYTQAIFMMENEVSSRQPSPLSWGVSQEEKSNPSKLNCSSSAIVECIHV